MPQATSHLAHLHSLDAKCISTPSLPSPKHCTKKHCVQEGPEQLLLCRRHAQVSVPSCHRGSNSSFQLGQGFLKGLPSPGAQESRVLKAASPTIQVGRHMPRQAPGTRRGHTPSSCWCSLGRNWDYAQIGSTKCQPVIPMGSLSFLRYLSLPERHCTAEQSHSIL